MGYENVFLVIFLDICMHKTTTNTQEMSWIGLKDHLHFLMKRNPE